ncbi:MAG: autotransporter outer membrane beta-barrel domain-containing protein [Variovorax sp.]|nr:MAG: autotransporter outer membrane beta-barrel domain-containing protein [Variovorax sp.]
MKRCRRIVPERPASSRGSCWRITAKANTVPFKSIWIVTFELTRNCYIDVPLAVYFQGRNQAMNKSYRSVWNESSGAWVAAAENVSVGSSVGNTSVDAVSVRRVFRISALVVTMFMAGHAFAACGDAGGQRLLFANGGSSCVATLSTYSGQNVAYAGQDGSLLTFAQPNVTISSANTNVHLLSVGGSNGSIAGAAATIVATGNLTVNALANTGTTRAIYFSAGTNASGKQSRLQVDGNLIATLGGTAATVQNDGGDFEVFGTTRISSVNADVFRNNGLGSNVFHGAADISVTAAGSAGRGIGITGGSMEFQSNLGIRTTSGAGIEMSGGTIDAKGHTDIATTGAGTPGVYVAGASSVANFNSINVNTTGVGAGAVVAAGSGQVNVAQGANLTVNSGVGLQASGGGKIIANGLVTVNGANFNSVNQDGGAIALGAGSSIQLEDIAVHGTGTLFSSSGIAARQGASVQISGVTHVALGAGDYLTPIDTQGNGSAVELGTLTTVDLVGSSAGSAGVAAELGAGRITAAGPLAVRTEGTWGIFAQTASAIALKDINVQVGVDVNDDGALAGQNHLGSAAVYLDRQGSIAFGNATLVNNLWRGVYALGSGNSAVAATITGTGHADITTVLGAGGGRTGMADAVRAEALGATITLGSVTTRTTGVQSAGLRAIEGGVIALTGGTGRNNDIVTSGGAQGYGIEARGTGSSVTIRGADTAVNTSAADSHGVFASGGATVSAANLSVETAGPSSDGIRAVNGSAVTATGAMNVNVAGAAAGPACGQGVAICLVGDGSVVSGGSAAAASTIRSTGTAVRFESGANQVAALTNAMLSTSGAASELMSVSQAVGTSALNLRNSTAIASAGGLLLNVASGSTFVFDNDATTLTGDIKASADSTVNMALRNGSKLTGKIDPVNLAIDATSRWDVTGNSMLGTLTNAGTVHMLPGAGGLAGAYKTVTVDSYTGQGGRINLNTYLGDDSSPSDRLVINGGTATGTTTLGITNAGGTGAQTTGNGILLVDAQNGATTATNAFSAAGPVSAGAYDYSLVRRANESWYLTSDLVPPVDPGTPPVNPPVNPPTAPVIHTPNYRQETSLYAAVPSLAILHSAATMDSFHERVGAAGPVAGLGDRPTRLWARVIGNTGERKGDAQGVYGRTGPAFDHKTYALQLGGELYRGANADGSQTAAGVYLATGRTSGDVEHFNGRTAGHAKLDVSSLGVYWTVLGPAGGYVDFVAQGNHYGVTATSTRMPEVKTSGTGYDLSVEGGWPFQLSGAWTLEPQVQARLMAADFDRTQDIAGRVGYDDAESLVGRAGLKLAYKGADLTGWARLDLLKEFKGRSKTQVSSLWGTNGVDFHSSVHGAAVALTAGVDAKLTDKVSLYGAASYRRALGDNRGHAWGAQAGVKVAW